MSRIYDNWERLVAAVLRRVELLKLFRSDSINSSSSSLSSEFSPSPSDRFSFNIPSDSHPASQQHPLSFANSRLDPLSLPPTNPYLFRVGNNEPTQKIIGAGLVDDDTVGNSVTTEGYLVVGAPLWVVERRKPNHGFSVAGVSKLARSELETACEGFSNIVIGSSSTCVLYKGSLSNGVEITVAVASLTIASASAGHWSNSLERQFMKKIRTLSKVKHKNFLNIIGYCMEDEHLTRRMVFEYAPNGTLFEYLHIIEAERLDWAMRLRITMGIAYCLEHMHRLKPTYVHKNLTSSAVYLTEDYAAKVSDFFYWQDEVVTAKAKRKAQSDVYSFGVILFEMVTGLIPYSENWLSSYPGGVLSIRELIDPTLQMYPEDHLERIGSVIRSCVSPNPKERPTMKKVCTLLKEISEIGPDEASPMPL